MKTPEQFAAEYAERSGVTAEWLRDAGRVVEPCDCGDEICEGWQMGYSGGGYTLHLTAICERCAQPINGEVRQTGHRGICVECSDEMERAAQERSGGVLPVVIKTFYEQSEWCGSCGQRLARWSANYCYDCGTKVGRWSRHTHDVIVIEGWSDAVEMIGESWRDRINLRAYHPVRLKDAGWLQQ